MPETRVIHHFPVTSEVVRHMVPAEAQIVSAALRPRSKLAIYVEHMNGDKKIPMDLVFVATGEQFTNWPMEFVGTVSDGPFMWHVYAKIHRG